MKEFAIRLCSVQDVHDFVDLATTRPFNIRVSDGSYCVDAKSYMEMFCLNFNNQLQILSEGYDWEFEQFLRDADRFRVY